MNRRGDFKQRLVRVIPIAVVFVIMTNILEERFEWYIAYAIAAGPAALAGLAAQYLYKRLAR